jgi:DNA-binding transcriptional MocR family regulator
VAEAAARVLGADGDVALSYGASAGPRRLIDALAERWAGDEGRWPGDDAVVVTAGASHALDLVAGACRDRGDVVLVESPTYDLALGVLRDRGLRPVALPVDDAGVIPEALPDMIASLRRRGRRPALAYLVATFGNPRGTSLPLARRRALVEIAATHDLIVVEDDVYRELPGDGSAPPSLWSLDEGDHVVRIGSVSKCLGPGLRVGWLAAPGELAARIRDGGLLTSGGGIAHLAAMIVADLYASGALDAHLTRLRCELRARAEALVGALHATLPPEAAVDLPEGGYFAWLRLPPDMDGDALLAETVKRGVGFRPGRLFHLEGGAATARLCFALYPPDALAAAGRRIGEAVDALGRR